MVWQADLCGYAGLLTEGLRLLEEAKANADATGNFHAVAELYRLQGEFLQEAASERSDEVEHCFRQDAATAHRQQAKALELRASVSLSRLLQQKGKRNDARRELAEVYGWFTEGFDTADLQAAKALLNELSADGVHCW